MTNFFEVINLSATHIYHSALELSPTSSIIRKLYYHRRITSLPRVVTGTPESWPQTISTYGRENHKGPCIWSPCGRFIAAQMGGAVDIRNQLTLELITTLHPTETIPHLKGPLAYSPDGRSIACTSDTAIIIWDVQTGGVAKEIKCSANSVSLVWSSDGRMICTINLGGWGDFIVHKYDTSGTTLSSHTLLSRDIPHLWTDEESFWVLTTLWGKYPNGHTIDIFNVGSTSLTKIRSFALPRTNGAVVGSFSQTTHRISISDGDSIRILDMQSSECLLNEPLQLSSHCFSSDGSRFAAYGQIEIYVWEYGSGRYVLLGEFQCHHVSISPLRFSPTPSSILGRANGILQVWRLHELPTSSRTRRRQYAGLSRSHWGQRVVYQAGTLEIHCKDMDKVPTIYRPGHWKYIQNFPS